MYSYVVRMQPHCSDYWWRESEPSSGYGFDFGGLALSNIDRIEVLRGEQSALWGSDAMGGVIYITTKKGLEKRQNLQTLITISVQALTAQWMVH